MALERERKRERAALSTTRSRGFSCEGGLDQLQDRQTCTHTQTCASSPSQLTLTLTFYTPTTVSHPHQPTPHHQHAHIQHMHPIEITATNMHSIHSSPSILRLVTPSHLFRVFSSPLGRVGEGQKYPRLNSSTHNHPIPRKEEEGCKNRFRSFGGRPHSLDLHLGRYIDHTTPRSPS